MDIETYFHSCQRRINKALKKILPTSNKKPKELHQAMRYAVLSGGKRIRAVLLYATGEALGANKAILDQLGAAVEMIHAFTLIHDDLPALDNDDLRRGKPSCHKAFSEATAILAGDALQALAFKTISNLDKTKINATTKLKMVEVLSQATLEVIRGEEADILMEGKKISLKELKYNYLLKTSYLLTASILLGALGANCQNLKTLKALKNFGDYIGLVFQIHDDILGITIDTSILGKPQASDEIRQKPTYPSLLGIKHAKKKEQDAFLKAMKYLRKSRINEDILSKIAIYIMERNY